MRYKVILSRRSKNIMKKIKKRAIRVNNWVMIQMNQRCKRKQKKMKKTPKTKRIPSQTSCCYGYFYHRSITVPLQVSLRHIQTVYLSIPLLPLAGRKIFSNRSLIQILEMHVCKKSNNLKTKLISSKKKKPMVQIHSRGYLNPQNGVKVITYREDSLVDSATTVKVLG